MKNVFLLLICLSLSLQADITLVSDNDHATVQAALNAAANGDTILLTNRNSAGGPIAYWASVLTNYNKMVTIQGMGTNETIIQDENPTRSSITMFDWKLSGNLTGISRVTGIQFRSGVTNTSNADDGPWNIQALGDATGRVDRCYWEGSWGRFAFIYGGSKFVFDQNYVNLTNTSGFYCRSDLINSGTNRGNNIWATNVAIGVGYAGPTIETNYFSRRDGAIGAMLDGDAGCWVVVRHNFFDHCNVQNHEMGQGYRGPRGVESYFNTFSNGLYTAAFPHFIRGGSGVIFSNSILGSWSGVSVFNYQRATDPFSQFGQARGTNEYDTNITGVIFTGTHNGSIDGTNRLVDTTATWNTSEWYGYSVWQDETGKVGLVSTNTATTMSFVVPTFAVNVPVWTNGQTYSVYKIIQSIDQPGVGKGDQLFTTSGSLPLTNTVFNAVHYPRHEYDPIWYWGNTLNGSANSVVSTSYGMIVPGLNYTNAVRTNYTQFAYPNPIVTLIDGNTTTQPTRGKSLEPGRGRIR